ncbi:MAG: carnitine dehydratase [Clostridiales bacterium]|nr:MAG: carnitine dehydratase [Clostridiales bacterium]
MGPLDGIKVIDMTRVLAGPFCTMILADMGAEVIKIERPLIGDDSRAFGPFIGEESAYFMSINRNKKSITLNLKEQKAIDILKELVKQSDVIVENFRPGTMEKLGIGYSVLKKINEKIIYASASGFGQTGPYSRRPAYDGVVQAMGGIMSITGQKGGKATRVGPSIGDITAGLYTTIGILMALYEREKSGNGQMVDVAMLDCQVSILENALARYFSTGVSPVPSGNKHNSIVPFEPFETNDGEIMIAAGNDRLFKTLAKLIGRDDLSTNPKFETNPKRNENYDELREIIETQTKTNSVDYWYKLLTEAGVPCGPINNIERLVNDEQVNFREMILDIVHPVAGNTRIPGLPIKMSRTKGAIKKAAPILGCDTTDVLKSLGYSKDEIKTFSEQKII